MSPDEFRELLRTRGVAVECPVCGAEDWRGLDDVIDLPVRVAGPTSSEAHVRIPGFEALAPSCGRCGNVRLIDLRWLGGSVPQSPALEPARESAPDVEVPDADHGQRSRISNQPLTNIWGQPIAKGRGRKR